MAQQGCSHVVVDIRLLESVSNGGSEGVSHPSAKKIRLGCQTVRSGSCTTGDCKNLADRVLIRLPKGPAAGR